MFSEVVSFIRTLYATEESIPLHVPRFTGKEKNYLNECIDSTMVSSVGAFVDQFESGIAEFTGAQHAVAISNGTSALHLALVLSHVERDDEVITQPLTFVATANAISYLGAHPVFIDVDRQSLGLSPEKLEDFLKNNTKIVDGVCVNKTSNRKIKAVVPMHTFGMPCEINEIKSICDRYHIKLVEDAAEALGSYAQSQHAGTFGDLGVLSFNGNKIITTGGGGMIITNNEELAIRAKHISTTAKIPHSWEYDHDTIGYNYRLPNVNAALGCAQLEQLPDFLKQKSGITKQYQAFFKARPEHFVTATTGTESNNWLNAIILEDREQRDQFLQFTNDHGIQTRPIWRLMNHLKMFSQAQAGNLENALWLEDRVVNLPSSVPM